MGSCTVVNPGALWNLAGALAAKPPETRKRLMQFVLRVGLVFRKPGVTDLPSLSHGLAQRTQDNNSLTIDILNDHSYD